MMANKPGSEIVTCESILSYAKNFIEPKSKRTPVRLRHKIEKASVAKQRKQRKLAKNVWSIVVHQ